MLEKVKEYISKNQLSAEDGDSLWRVIDVDRWPQEQIEELHAFCSQKANWHLVVSNPCIEIWLLYHKRTDLTDLGIQNAKQALDKIEEGGYYYIKYLPLMLDAIENACNADTNSQVGNGTYVRLDARHAGIVRPRDGQDGCQSVHGRKDKHFF